MKFTCERCGKKYATAEDPAPGRVYKLKCKSCGHLIVVKAPSAGPPPLRPESGRASAGLDVGTSADLPPELQLDGSGPERQPEPSNGAFSPTQMGEPTTEISMPPISPPEADEKPPALPESPSGYVDLFADGPGADSTSENQDDPFLAAARASLPDGYGSGAPAPDPFAPMRDDVSRPAESSESEDRPLPTPRIPVIPKPPQQKSSLPIALIGGGVAVLIAILVFTLFTFGKKGAPPPTGPVPAAHAPAPAPVAQAPQPPAPQPPAPQAQPQAPAAQPSPPPVAAAPQPKQAGPSAEERQAKEERAAKDREAREKETAERLAKERAAKEERAAKDREARDAREKERAERTAKERAAKEERAAKDREAREAREKERADRIAAQRAAREERDRAAREARAERERLAREAKERDKAEKERAAAERAAATASAEAEGGLTPSQVEKVIASTKKAFDGCIQAAKGTDVKLDGRKVMLRLNIQNNGAVTYPTLDDVTLNATDLGQCLKNASRLMVFPKFKGDTMHVEVPLALNPR